LLEPLRSTDRHPYQAFLVTLLETLAAILLLLVAVPTSASHTVFATPADGAGYIDFSFYYPSIPGNLTSTDLVQTPTGEKPQSKLWYNDGRWWADLFNPATGAYHIYSLDTNSQEWSDTNVALDTRPRTKADCLWDGIHLYVVSGGGQVSTGADLSALLYRYSYNSTSHSYTPDANFPVMVRSGGAETIVIDKDTSGVLWVTYTQNNRVYVSHTLGADTVWTTPAVISAAGVNPNVAPDDISSLIAYNGKIGVMWSNQNDGTFYFAYHTDGAGDNSSDWTGEVVAGASGLADDHLSLKSLEADASGNVFAALKTSFINPAQPRILLLAGTKQNDGSLSWQSATVSNGAMNETRPIVLIDTTHRQLYVFLSDEGGGKIYYKTTSLDNITFNPNTKGTEFISDSKYPYINNVTSTKQNVNGATGIVVLASYDNDSHPDADPAATDFYMHNVIAPTDPTPSNTPTSTTTATPTITATPTTTATPTNTPQVLLFSKIYLPLLNK